MLLSILGQSVCVLGVERSLVECLPPSLSHCGALGSATWSPYLLRAAGLPATPVRLPSRPLYSAYKPPLAGLGGNTLPAAVRPLYRARITRTALLSKGWGH